MDIKPIKTESDYRAALEEVERLFEAEKDTPKGDKLDVLTTLIEAYEEQHAPISLPDPIETIWYYMESRGISLSDLELYIGEPACVSEVMNRKRPLSIEMIRNLNAGLGISADILIQSYSLEKNAA